MICHSLLCPTCGKEISGEDPCHEECPHCEYPYHKHCWEENIQAIGKCAFCLNAPPNQALCCETGLLNDRERKTLREALYSILEKARKYEILREELECDVRR